MVCGILAHKSNEPLPYKERGTPAECGGGLKLAIGRGWLWLHESGTYMKLTEAGGELLRVREANALTLLPLSAA
jgi:hypothetical protein